MLVFRNHLYRPVEAKSESYRREEAIMLKESPDRWFKIEVYELPFGPQGPGWYISWFILSDLLARQRTGAGKRYYEFWESQLPANVDIIYLHALPKAAPFWRAMGYTDSFDRGDTLMVKSVKGNPVPPVPFDEEMSEQLDYMTMNEEVDYAPDMSLLKKGK